MHTWIHLGLQCCPKLYHIYNCRLIHLQYYRFYVLLRCVLLYCADFLIVVVSNLLQSIWMHVLIRMCVWRWDIINVWFVGTIQVSPVLYNDMMVFFLSFSMFCSLLLLFFFFSTACVPIKFSCFMFSGARRHTGLLTSMYKICTYINICCCCSCWCCCCWFCCCYVCFSCMLFVCVDADSSNALEHVLNSYKQALLALSLSISACEPIFVLAQK